MLTINVHPSREDQVKQQFYWPRSCISLQGPSVSLAFVQILFGGGGVSSSKLVLKLSHLDIQILALTAEEYKGKVTLMA